MMYILLIFLLLAAGVYLAATGFRKSRKLRAYGGVLVVLGTFFLFGFLGFWGDMLWFSALGYGQRFWTVVLAKAGFAVAGGLFGWFAVTALIWNLGREKKLSRLAAKAVGAFIGLNWGYTQWEVFLKYFNRVMPGVQDPIIGKSTGFYLFSLPFYDTLYSLFLLLALVALAASLFSTFFKVTEGEVQLQPAEPETRKYSPVFVSGGALLLVFAWGKFLNRYHLMFSPTGVVTGAGWTDVHIRLYAYSIVAIFTAALGIGLIVPSLRRRLRAMLGRYAPGTQGGTVFFLGTAAGSVAAVWILFLAILPGLFQWLRVEPNEISFEKPYIEHNIRFTRQGFKLHEVEEKEFPAREQFNREVVSKNEELFNNIRLWDYRALDSVLKQFQEIRLYYEFNDVDVDRYRIDGMYRQVMVSARELELANLPQDSQTFVNRRFVYTHGFGLALTPVQEFTSEGLPRLLVKDIPPVAAYSSLEVERPEIYYGELTGTHVIANSERAELDYPKGEENVYTRYSGSGGVPMTGLWRKFLYGWKFDGTRLLLSGYPTKESRIMFHRDIRDRVQTLAPFLVFDRDPYVVLAEGKLYWIMDAYTTSEYYPYSEPYRAEVLPVTQTYLSERNIAHLTGVNYIRNSVKVVVDAFNGSVDFYVFEPDDPLVQVWRNIFPELFKDKEKMPPHLFSHVRYPLDLLLIQGLVYAKYHMTDPVVFYNQEDLWVRATEKYYGSVQPVEPYYIMWEPPGSNDLEFVLILPFTPKNKQVLIGWIAGMCDGENYGRFLSYKFPKEKRIIGPQQVETKIDQDRFLSGQLSLWDQRGSRVIRGNVLAIPVQGTLLYVEPIYLQAETSAYPELRLVTLMHGDNLSYGETFDEALEGLFEEGKPPIAKEKEALPAGLSIENLVSQANQAFEDYLRHLGNKEFAGASDALDTLQGALDRLAEQTTRDQ